MNQKKADKFLQKGIVLFDKDQIPDACTQFEKGVRLNQKDYRLHLWLAKCMAEFGSFENALVEFDNAIKLKPGNVQSHFEKGDTLALLGCFDEAIDEMNKAIELNPRNADYHYFKGLVHTSMKDYEKALMEFDSSLELLPDSSEFHQAKTEALIQLGRTTEALEEQNKVHTMTEDFERHPLRYEGALEIRRGYFFQKLDEK